MTSRERVLRAMKHMTTDRVPIDKWFGEEVEQRLMEHLGCATVAELDAKLGVDFVEAGIRTHDEAYEKRCNGVLRGTVEFSGKSFVFCEDGTFEDEWGIVRRVGADGLYTQWLDGPFVKNDDLDSFAWPELSVLESQESLSARFSELRSKDSRAIRSGISNPFKTAWHMRGMENYLCDMLLEPEWASELIRRAAVYEKEKGVRLAKAETDIIAIYGDIATQTSLLFSEQVYRDILKPVLADMVAAFRQTNPNILVFFHSDGCLDKLMEELIDTGFDIINPIQPECMNIFDVKDRYGDRISIHGGVSIQELLPHGTPEQVREEARRIIDHCSKNGGYVLCPANQVQNDVPMENLAALYEEAQR